MGAMTNCTLCGIECKDNEPSQSLKNKFCCKEHWLIFLNKNGPHNKGRKWNEIYTPETEEKLRKSRARTGEDNPLYGKKRPDVVLRNILNNPMHSEEKKKELNNLIRKDGLTDKVILNISKLLGYSNKIYAYQRKSYKAYGEKCLICGRTKKDMQLDVHHRNKNRSDQSIKNIPPLCASCHTKLHRGVISDDEIEILVNKKLQKEVENNDKTREQS